MNELKRRDVGVAGTLIILSQAIGNFQSSSSISEQIDELKYQIQNSKVEREQYFVRKTELAFAMKKIDKISEQMVTLKEQVSFIRNRVENAYSLSEDGSLEIIACNEVTVRD